VIGFIGFISMWTATPTATRTLSPTATIPTSAPNAPPLTWNRVSGVIGYQVEVDNQSDFLSPVFTSPILSSDTLVYPTSSLGEGLYFWYVRALKPDGSWTAWSNLDTFLIDLP
jgi:hypothetical protein